MHPILNHKFRLITFITVWLFFGLMITAVTRSMVHAGWLNILALTLPAFLLHAFLALSVFYLCRAFPLKETKLQKLFTVFLISGVLTNAIWCGGFFFLNSVGHFSLPTFSDENDLSGYWLTLFTAGLFLYWLSAAAHYLILESERAMTIEKQAIELQLLARENELQLLRSQIDSHFLFNALNSLNALIPTDPESARRMTCALADFFRQSLEMGRRAFVTVREETELIRHYLSVEEARYADRLRYMPDVDPVCFDKSVPVFLLQPLVENAVKHGISGLLEGGTITLRIWLEHQHLHIRIQNPYDPDNRPPHCARIGLANTRKRLEILYPGRASLEISDKEAMFTVHLILPGENHGTLCT